MKEFTYDEYKIKAIKEDVKRLESHLKPFWFENVPLIGSIFYVKRIQYHIRDIDRGLLRKNLAKYAIIWFPLIIITYFITPWFNYYVSKKAIKKTKEELIND